MAREPEPRPSQLTIAPAVDAAGPEPFDVVTVDTTEETDYLPDGWRCVTACSY